MLPGLNFVHLLVILVVALLVFGPEELPRLARRAAGLFQDVQRIRAQLHDEVTDLLNLDGNDDTGEPPRLDTPPLSAVEPSPPTSVPSQEHTVSSDVTPTGRRAVSRYRPPVPKVPSA